MRVCSFSLSFGPADLDSDFRRVLQSVPWQLVHLAAVVLVLSFYTPPLQEHTLKFAKMVTAE